MHVSDSGRAAGLTEVTDERAWGFGEGEGLFGRLEAEFFGVGGVVEAEG